jgi:anthraniloyl-CoA monooxygenase
MDLRRVAVLGGGPAGLLAARLLRLSRPDAQVTVVERQRKGGTYGFGVVLHHRAIRRLAEVDPPTHQAIVKIGHPLQTWALAREGESITVSNEGGLGVGRAALLRVLAEAATRSGARVRRGRAATPAEVADADLVIGADGSTSAARTSFQEHLGVTLDPLDLPYMWCGAPISPDGMLLSLRSTGEGVLAAHVMPYAGDRSTFQVDADRATLKASGLLPERPFDEPHSDARSMGYLERLFSAELGGARLEGNRSRWSTFITVSCQRWWHGRLVLVGDAAHTAHYTVGSGTRMAMEDSIALVGALDGHDSLAGALTAYEAERQPAVRHLQTRARRSQRWWLTVRHRVDQPLPRLMLSYLTRTGSPDHRGVAAANPDLLSRAARLLPGADLAAPRPAEIIAPCPLPLANRSFPTRLIRGSEGSLGVVVIDVSSVEAWTEGSEDLVARARTAVVGGAEIVLLAGGAGANDLLDRLAVAEQVKLQAGVPVAVEGSPEELEDVALGVLAGRADAAVLRGARTG